MHNFMYETELKDTETWNNFSLSLQMIWYDIMYLYIFQ